MTAAHAVEVSVVIPAYEARGFIGRAIDSALAQTLRATEIIVVDDASRDGTADAVASAYRGEPAVRVLRLTENGGPARARNFAIEAASGTWIALLDADDGWQPERLARLLAAADDCDAVFDNLIGVNPASGVRTAPIFPVFPQGSMSVRNLLEPMATQSRFDFGYLKPIVRRAFLVAHGVRYDERLRTSEDLVFYLTLLLEGARTRLIDDAQYLYTLPVSESGVRSGSSHSLPRDHEVGDALARVARRYDARIDADSRAALAGRIAHLHAIAPISDFYHARRSGSYGRMMLLMAQHNAVRREVLSKAVRRLSSRQIH